MNRVNFKKAVAAVFIMFLFTACSKKLMPPEIGSASGNIESSDLTASNVTPPKEEPLGGTGSTSETGDSEYFSEEPILESLNKGGGASDSSSNSFGSNPGSGGSGGSSMDQGQANIGNGSNGSYDGKSAWGSPDGESGLGSPDQMARMKKFQETSNLKDIHFNFDQYGLDSNSKEALQQNASYLKQNPGIKIEIQGHCDERGTNNYNIALGERRASSTKRYLVSQGIDSSRINIISFGEEKPFCFDSNEGCWFQNRRAHFMEAK